MFLKGVIEFPNEPNYQSHTQKLLLLNKWSFTANVLSAMIPAYGVPPPPPPTGFNTMWCFLLGFVKGNVFTTPPASIEDMRDRIVNELANLREDPEMIKKKGVQGGALNSALKGVEDIN